MSLKLDSPPPPPYKPPIYPASDSSGAVCLCQQVREITHLTAPVGCVFTRTKPL